MLRFKLIASDWLAGSLHFLILATAAGAEDAAVRPYALTAMAVVSFFVWIACYRRYRHIHDLPPRRSPPPRRDTSSFSGVRSFCRVRPS